MPNGDREKAIAAALEDYRKLMLGSRQMILGRAKILRELYLCDANDALMMAVLQDVGLSCVDRLFGMMATASGMRPGEGPGRILVP